MYEQPDRAGPPNDILERLRQLIAQRGVPQGAQRADTFQQGFQPPVQDWQQPRPRPPIPPMAASSPYGGQERMSPGAGIDPGMPRFGGGQMQQIQPGGQVDPLIAAIQRLMALRGAMQGPGQFT